jgi:hypothetical protein
MSQMANLLNGVIPASFLENMTVTKDNVAASSTTIRPDPEDIGETIYNTASRGDSERSRPPLVKAANKIRQSL